MIRRILLLISLLAFLTTGCIYKKPYINHFSGTTQGTTYSIVYEGKDTPVPAELKEHVEKILHEFDMSLSTYIDSSIISKINRNENVSPDTFFTDVFRKSVLISEMTGGAFDITVGPLVNAWGFGPDATKNFDESKHDSLMKLIGIDKVSLVNGRIVKTNPGVKLDVNAIAQGYSVDVICRYFDNLGMKNYLVEIGGEVRAKGKKGKELWRIGIDKPEDYNMLPGENLQAIITISDKSISTSGNYRKFYVENGVKYSHTIDPRTGYPAKNKLLSATIIADDCTLADGLATACMVMGKDDAISFITKNPTISAYFIFSDDEGNFNVWISENLKKFVTDDVR